MSRVSSNGPNTKPLKPRVRALFALAIFNFRNGMVFLIRTLR